MYMAVKGGEKAVHHSQKQLEKKRRGPESIPEIGSDQIQYQLGLAVDRVMAEGAFYDPKAAAVALKQAQGDAVEAVFLLRSFRNTLKRYGSSRPLDTQNMQVIRRISGIYKDIPGGQLLGPTYDYSQKILDFTCQTEPARNGDKNATTDKTTPQAKEEPARNCSWVVEILKSKGLLQENPESLIGEPVADLTQEPLCYPASRSLRLQRMARGDEGFLLGSAYSLQRGFGMDVHPFLAELRVGHVMVSYTPPELGFEINLGKIKVTEAFVINRKGKEAEQTDFFEAGYGLVFGHNERKAISMALLDRSLQNSEKKQARYPAQDHEFILSHSDNVEASGFLQHLKLPHYVAFQSELISARPQDRKEERVKKRKKTVESSI